jgi:hypothetical protein
MQNKRINTNFVPAELIDGDSLNRRFLLNSWGIEPQLFKAELIFRLIITRQIKMFTKVLFKIKTTVNFFQDDTNRFSWQLLHPKGDSLRTTAVHQGLVPLDR